MFLLKKTVSIFLLPLMLCLIGLQSNGQAFKFLIPTYSEVDEAKGFFVKEGNYTQGFLYFNPNKPGEVDYSAGRKGERTTYTADELTEFGIDDSRVSYVAQNLSLGGQPQRVFIEVIMKDSLFYFHQNKTFFTNNNGSLMPLTQQDLLPYLQSLSGLSAKWKNELHLIKLKHPSLRYFARNRVAGKSPTVLFTNAGFFMSFNNSTLTPTGSANLRTRQKFQEATSDNISAGVFADLPAWELNNLSLFTQLGYGKMRFNETVKSGRNRYDIKLDLDYIRFAPMPKYTLSFSKLRVFAQAGPRVMYNLKHETQAMETIVEGNRAYVSEQPGLEAKKVMLGVEAGAGISFFFLPGHYLSVQFNQAKNYSKAFNISNQSVTVSVNL